MNRRARIRDKIMARVDIVQRDDVDPALGPCHVWQGPCSGEAGRGRAKGRGHSYPRMNLDGQTVAVHRVNWTNEHGYIPGKKQLDHLCKNRRCVRVSHLETVTHKTNQKRKEKPCQTKTK